MQSQKRRPLRRKVSGEFEEDISIGKLIETLVKSFLKSDSDYGAITDIKTDVDSVFKLAREYISKEDLDICVLKIGNSIFMSKTSARFDDIYKVIKKNSQLTVKRDIIEIWDDAENGILHFLVLPLRKHFPIDYESNSERREIINALLKECVEYH